MQFLTSWTFIIIMIVLLLVLLGVFFYLRKQPEDED